MTETRVRFAPSPTGPLHIGGVRTALYNYLYAKKNNGKFILRIEDTDQSRFVEGAEAYILDSLKWLDILPDESPVSGGEYGPYRQSERKEIYWKYAQQLINDGKAYYAFDTPEELEAMRTRLKEAKVDMPQYNSVTRKGMKNSLTLSEEEVKQRISDGIPYVIRLKVPELTEIRFKDIIRGWVHVQSSTIDDKVLMKSDGMPTYHLANVIDDYLMKITTVIRGEEWLPSAPLHILLYQYLGLEKEMPEFAHLPLILKPEGTGKLSKRDGDKHGFPVFPIAWNQPDSKELIDGFREYGYLHAATINFLSLLGWNSGTEQEIFNLSELAEIFTLERVNKSGAKFDIEKAKWINQQYIKKLSSRELGDYLEEGLGEKSREFDRNYIEEVAEAFKERITFPNELKDKALYFFERPVNYDEKVVKKKWNLETVEVLTTFSKSLSEYSMKINKETAYNILNEVLEEKGIGMGKIMQGLRLAITGEAGGIDLMFTIELLGSTEVSRRIEFAVNKLHDQVK